MSAGLPGLGLSGLFVLLTALALPAVHHLRSPRPAKPARFGALFALAVSIAAVAVLSWMLLAFVVDEVQPSQRHGSVGSFQIFGAPVIAASLAILTAILLLPEVLLHLLGTRPTPKVPPVQLIRRELTSQQDRTETTRALPRVD
jgi:hypothetical protein